MTNAVVLVLVLVAVFAAGMILMRNRNKRWQNTTPYCQHIRQLCQSGGTPAAQRYLRQFGPSSDLILMQNAKGCMQGYNQICNQGQ
jgi:hypothetical protein